MSDIVETTERTVKWCDVSYQERLAAILSHAVPLKINPDTMARIFDVTNPTIIFTVEMINGTVDQLLQCRIAPESVDVFKIAHQAYGKE